MREVLREEGFAPLPRRGDDERLEHLGPTAEAVADVREFALQPGTQFTTRCGGLFLFLPDLVRLQLEEIAARAKLPGSRMIPSSHALRCALALKLWSIERKSHVMSTGPAPKSTWAASPGAKLNRTVTSGGCSPRSWRSMRTTAE